MNPTVNSYQLSPVVLLDLEMKQSCVHVMIPRGHMMLHPVGTVKDNKVNKTEPPLNYSCLLSPQDLGKHMTGMTAMEVMI